MTRMFHGHGKPPAQAPGTLTFVGARKVDRVDVDQIVYGPTMVEYSSVLDLSEVRRRGDEGLVTWLDIRGLHDTDLIAQVGETFGLHPLVLEDIVNPNQRPKVEDHDDHLYIVLRMLDFDVQSESLASEQVSLIIGPDYLITFQERPGDAFDPVRERLHRGRGRIRTAGTGYLGYALLDAVIDRYFTVLESLDGVLENVEDQVLENPCEEVQQRIHHLKREMVMLRRMTWPVREIITRLERDESPIFGEAISPFLRDLQDHIMHVGDTVDAFRDILSGLQDLYMSSISNRLNDVMKVLTIFASIFVPLTFIAGVYGMNFEHMPELHWRYSYPVFWGVIIILGVALLILFRRRKWL